MESEIWESENRNLRVNEIIKNLASDLKNISKSQKDNYIKKKLREFLEENKILD